MLINLLCLLQRKLLDGSLGFSSGVMIAASFWSLLAPAIELAEQDSTYGDEGQFSFIPALVGFMFGAFFVYLSDVFITLYEMDVLNIIIPGNYFYENKFYCTLLIFIPYRTTEQFYRIKSPKKVVHVC